MCMSPRKHGFIGEAGLTWDLSYAVMLEKRRFDETLDSKAGNEEGPKDESVLDRIVSPEQRNRSRGTIR